MMFALMITVSHVPLQAQDGATTSLPVNADVENVNCGFAAFDLVLRAYGKSYTGPAGIESEESINLKQMRELFETEGLVVKSFRLTSLPSRQLSKLLARLADENCSFQAVVLVPTNPELKTDIKNPGHYFVVKQWNVNSTNLIDPQTLTERTMDLENAAVAHGVPVFIQLIFRPYDTCLYSPIGWREYMLTFLLFGMFVRMVRESRHADKGVDSRQTSEIDETQRDEIPAN